MDLIEVSFPKLRSFLGMLKSHGLTTTQFERILLYRQADTSNPVRQMVDAAKRFHPGQEKVTDNEDRQSEIFKKYSGQKLELFLIVLEENGLDYDLFW